MVGTQAKGFSTTIHEMNVKPGSVWRHTMHGPTGVDYPNESHFVEVIKHEKIVYEHSGSKVGKNSDAQFVLPGPLRIWAAKLKLP